MSVWWNGLNIFQQVSFVLAIASSLILITDLVLFLVNFYAIDRLNAESINIERYDVVANNDSDMFKATTQRVVSVKSLNIFVAITCWLFFSLYNVLSITNLIIISIVAGMYCACLDQLFLRFLRKK